MILKGYTFHYLFKLLKLLSLLTLSFLVLSLLWVAILNKQMESSVVAVPFKQNDALNQSTDQSVDYEKICTGPLESSSEFKQFPFPDFKQEMCFYGKNNRPDATVYDLLIHVGLKRSKQSLKVISGQKLYLTCAEEGPPVLQFSTKQTPLWLTPYVSDKGETFVEVGVRLYTKQNTKLIDEKKVLGIEQMMHVEKLAPNDPVFIEAIDEIRSAKWWASDLLYEAYGGENYSKLKDLERISFHHEGVPTVYPIEKGDAFIWKEGKWEPTTLGKLSRGHPLAYVKELTDKKLEWELWNENGLEQVTFLHKKEQPAPLHVKAEEIFSRVRQRTASRVSCRIGKTAVILKPGDWLLHVGPGWRVLKSLSEIEDVLSFQSNGELFIFDGIEKKDGKPVFSGTLFDLMRTQKQAVTISIHSQNNSEHSPHKKKNVSTKMQPTFSEKQSQSQEKEEIKKVKYAKRKAAYSSKGKEKNENR